LFTFLLLVSPFTRPSSGWYIQRHKNAANCVRRACVELLLLLLLWDARQRNIAVPFIYYLRLSWPYLEFHISVPHCRNLLNATATTDYEHVCEKRMVCWHTTTFSWLVCAQCHLWVGFVNNVGMCLASSAFYRFVLLMHLFLASCTLVKAL
jgi:hypothetical protein